MLLNASVSGLVAEPSDLVRETISGIERRLPASRFVRIHRSTIVSIAKVKEIKLVPGTRRWRSSRAGSAAG